jgi:hypothetical protein
VSGHELLLLADGVDEAERVRAEAEQADRRDRHEPEHAPDGHGRALAQARRREREKCEQQTGRHLHAHTRRQGERRSAVARRGLRAQRERRRHHKQDQGVVVRAPHRHHQQHGVQAHERGGPARAVAQAPRRPRDQCDRREA